MDRLYSKETQRFERTGFDLDRAGARLLGKDVRALTEGLDGTPWPETLCQWLKAKIDPEGSLRLASDMNPTQLEKAMKRLSAFHNELRDRQ